MSTFKKAVALLLVIAITAAIAVTGTLAYLKSEDSDVNVMTLGNVKIKQHEYERVVNDDGTYETDTIDEQKSYVLQDFTQGKPLLPIVGDPNEPGDSPAYAGWDTIPVRMSQVDSYGGMTVFAGKNAQDKFVTIENTGKTDAYVRTIIAIEIGSTDGALIGQSYQDSAWTRTAVGNIVINGNTYRVFEYNYPGARLSDGTYRHKNGILPAGDTTYPNLAQVFLKHNATNEDMEAIDGNKNGTLDILVVSQAVQAEGFADAKTALDTAFGKSSEKAAEWFGGMEVPVLVSTADELKTALESGSNIVLTDDIALADDATIAINSGASATLNLNGHTLSANNTRTATSNCMIDVNGGTLNISNGTVSMNHTGDNMGWNGATTVINVTAGGVLNLDGVTVKNEGGTDMNFAVHLNNWGEVTMNANNCVFDATYCGVRVFNSGFDMNNVKITNSKLTGNTRAFWVHNYIGDLDRTKHSDDAIKARLNLDIYGNNNTFEITETATSPIRYGFGTTVYYDANGNVVTP